MPALHPSSLFVSSSCSGSAGRYWLRRREVNMTEGGREREGDWGWCKPYLHGHASNGQGRYLHLTLAEKLKEQYDWTSPFFTFPKQRATKHTIVLILALVKSMGVLPEASLELIFVLSVYLSDSIFFEKYIYPELQVCEGSSCVAKQFKFSHFVVIKVLPRIWKCELLCWTYSFSFITSGIDSIFIYLTVMLKSSSVHLNVAGQKPTSICQLSNLLVVLCACPTENVARSGI